MSLIKSTEVRFQIEHDSHFANVPYTFVGRALVNYYHEHGNENPEDDYWNTVDVLECWVAFASTDLPREKYVWYKLPKDGKLNGFGLSEAIEIHNSIKYAALENAVSTLGAEIELPGKCINQTEGIWVFEDRPESNATHILHQVIATAHHDPELSETLKTNATIPKTRPAHTPPNRQIRRHGANSRNAGTV